MIPSLIRGVVWFQLHTTGFLQLKCFQTCERDHDRTSTLSYYFHQAEIGSCMNSKHSQSVNL